MIPEVTIYPELNFSIDSKAEWVELQIWPPLKDLNIPETDVREMHLLSGLDCPDLLRSSEERYGGKKEPFTRHTTFGWAINGPLGMLPGRSQRSHFVSVNRASPECDLECPWEIQGSQSEERGMSIEDRRILDIWDQSKKLDDRRYSLDIPFKNENLKMDDNCVMAEKRSESLCRHLNKAENLKERYTGEIKKLLNNGHAEVVPEDQLQRADGKIWCLPH